MATVRHSCCTVGNFAPTFQLQSNDFTQKYQSHLLSLSRKCYRSNDRNQILTLHYSTLPTLPLGTAVFLPDCQETGMSLANQYAIHTLFPHIVESFSKIDITSISYQIVHILSQKLTILILLSPTPHQQQNSLIQLLHTPLSNLNWNTSITVLSNSHYLQQTCESLPR